MSEPIIRPTRQELAVVFKDHRTLRAFEMLFDRVNMDSFLGTPDQTDETATHTYSGWTNVNGGWLIRRTVRTTNVSMDANAVNNASYTDLTSAWSNRVALVYS